MPETVRVRWIGMPKLLKKLDAELQIGPQSQQLLDRVGNDGKGYLLDLMPGDWDRPRAARLQVTENSARLSIPRYPYIFFERGSAYPSAGRVRRRRTQSAFTALGRAGGLRIRPRRYLRRTGGRIRRQLIQEIETLKSGIVREWTA